MPATTAMLEPFPALLPARSSPLPAMAAPSSPAKAASPGEERPYRGDWVAMVVWIVCFTLMGLIHLTDLIVSLNR